MTEYPDGVPLTQSGAHECADREWTAWGGETTWRTTINILHPVTRTVREHQAPLRGERVRNARPKPGMILPPYPAVAIKKSYLNTYQYHNVACYDLIFPTYSRARKNRPAPRKAPRGQRISPFLRRGSNTCLPAPPRLPACGRPPPVREARQSFRRQMCRRWHPNRTFREAST